MSADRPPRSRTRKLSDAVGPYVVRSVERYAPEEVCFCLPACASTATEGKSADRRPPSPAAAARASSQLCLVTGLFRSATSTASASEIVRPVSFSGANSGGGGTGVGAGATAPAGGVHRVEGVSGASALQWAHPARSTARLAAAKARTAGLVTISFYHCRVVPRPIALSGLIAVATLAAGCGGTRPMPTLDEYSFGTAEFVEELREDFLEGKRGEGVGAMESATAAPLRELGERWRSACGKRCSSAVRIVDLQKKSSSDLTLRVEVRLQGWARAGDAERVAAVALFDLSLFRGKAPDSLPGGGWRLRSAGAGGGAAAIQRGVPHLFEEAEARGLVAPHETLDPVEATNLCLPATHHHPGVLLVDVNGDGTVDVIVT